MAKNYVDNKKLWELVKRTIELTCMIEPPDWLDDYESKCNNKLKKGTYSQDEFDKKKEFINRRRNMYSELGAQFQAMSDDEKRKCFKELEDVRGRVLIDILKIMHGRLNTLGICKGREYSSSMDIEMESLMTILKYLNRYDYENYTNVFAYFTEVGTMSMFGQTNKESDEKKKICSLQFYENVEGNDMGEYDE